MSALKPDAVNTHDLGTSALPWKDLHVDQITMGARAGGTTLTLGSAALLGLGDAVDLVVHGSLTVNGNTTTLSSTELVIEDKTITLASGAADSAAADGAGITVGGASATLIYDHTGTQWEFNKNVETAGSLLPEDTGKANFDLGSTAQPWNDLFLSNAGVINFANTNDPIDGSDLTLTHSENLLTIAGGNTRVDRLEIDSASDYLDVVDTDLQLVAAADIVLDPAGGDVKIDGNAVPNADDGGSLGSADLNWSDLYLADSAVISLGDDQDVTLTHVPDTGLLVGGASELQFRDSGLKISSSDNGQLDIDSDGEIEISAATNLDIDAAALQIDTTGAYDITGAGNSSISTTGTGTLTIDSAGALVIDTDGTDSISLGTEAAAKTITIGNDASTKVDVNALAIELDSAGSILLDSATTTDLDSAGILSINSSAAAINIGNDAVAQPINIGTGAAARTITIGEDASTKVDVNALAIELDAGTSGFTIDGAAASSVSTSDGELTVNGKTGLNLQEDGISVIAIDTDRDVLFSQTGGSTGDPDVEFDGYVRFDGASEFDGAVQVDGTLTANAAVSVQSTLTVGEDDTGYDVKLFGATSGQYLLWDESADELVLAGDSKLSFHDAAGGENILASADGHLEVNAGSTLDMTAPTIDINASSEVTIDTDTVTVGSANASDPLFVLKNTTNDADGARLRFVKDKGAAGAQGDDAGVIQFFADNAAQQQTEFARVTAEVQTATDGEEGGKLSLSVAEHDGTMTAGLVLTEGSTDGVIDVTIGAGSGSTTTIAGNLTVNGTTTTVNSTTVQVDDKNIELGVGSVNDAAADGGGITLKSGDGDKTFNWVNATNSWTSSEDLDLVVGKHLSIAGTAVLTADGVAKVQSGVAGAGLSHSNGVLALDIDELSALGGTGIDQADHFVFSDAGTEKKITFSNLEDAIFANVSGDATVAAGGALTIAAGAIEHGMLAEDIISGQAELLHANIADADDLMIHDTADNVVKKVGVDSLRDHYFGVVSGDIVVADGGAATIQANAVEGSMLHNNVVSGQTEHTGVIDDTDEFLISDAGIIKRTDFSVLRDAVFADVSGDATVAAGGALTIAAGAVENSMLANDHITIAGDSGSQDIHLNDTLTISGTEGEIETSVSGDTITIGLPDDVDIDGTLTVASLSSLDGGVNINDQVIIASNNGDYLSTNGDLTLTNGNLTLTSGDLEVGGDLTVSSALSSNGTELTIKDSHVLFASAGANNISPGQTFDMGFYAKRDSASASSHVGLIYDNETSGSKWRLHEGLSAPNGITGKFDFSGSTASTLEVGGLLVVKTGSTSDQATSSGNFTSNVASISHTLTFDGDLADDISTSITVTSDKVLATSVVMGSASLNADLRIHTVTAGSFICEITNKSGSAFSGDSTIVLNFVVM